MEETNKKIDELTAKVEEYEEKIGEYDEKIGEMENKLKEMNDLIEKHKHSGKETSDISQILLERLGIKVGAMMGAAETYSIEFGGFKHIGRAAFGRIVLEPITDKYFGLYWKGGGNPRITTILDIVPNYANNAAAVADGLTEGQFYRTGGDPDSLCIVH